MTEIVDKTKFSAAIFRRGQKKELFEDGDNDMSEKLELDQKLNELHEMWNIPRGGKDLSAAIWRPNSRSAEVVLQKGKMFSHMGFIWGKKLHLHIEEAVYLIDRPNLLLFIEQPHGKKRLLSLSEAKELMIQCGVSMEVYLVYCKLMRAGYIVHRHPSSWILKASELPMDIFQNNNTKTNIKRETFVAHSTSSPATVSKSESIQESAPYTKKQRLESKKIHATAQLHRSWWLFPSNTAIPSPIKESSKTKDSWLCGAVSMADENIVNNLPRCLIDPGAIAKAAVQYPEMQPLNQLSFDDLISVDIRDDRSRDGVMKSACGGVDDTKYMLQFDIYSPNSQFSRKTPGIPLFCICVPPHKAPPTVEALMSLEASSNGIAIRYSTVEYGDIAFYAIGKTDLRNILR